MDNECMGRAFLFQRNYRRSSAVMALGQERAVPKMEADGAARERAGSRQVILPAKIMPTCDSSSEKLCLSAPRDTFSATARKGKAAVRSADGQETAPGAHTCVF